MLAPVEAEPAHVALDGVDILLLFLGRVGVVEAQVAAAAELLGDAEVEADRLGVADVQVAVRLGRKAGHHRRVPLGVEVGLDDVADEIAPAFCYSLCASPCLMSTLSACLARSRLVPNPRLRQGPSPRSEDVSRSFYATWCANIDARQRIPASSDMTETVVTRFAPSPTGFLHIGGGAHRAVQLALRARPRRQDAAADRGHRPRALHRAGDRRDPRRACPGSASIGTARPSTSSRASSATARWSSRCSPRARPIAATPRRKSSPRCARRPAPRARPGSTTAAGATAIRPTRRPASSPRSG